MPLPSESTLATAAKTRLRAQALAKDFRHVDLTSAIRVAQGNRHHYKSAQASPAALVKTHYATRPIRMQRKANERRMHATTYTDERFTSPQRLRARFNAQATLENPEAVVKLLEATNESFNTSASASSRLNVFSAQMNHLAAEYMANRHLGQAIPERRKQCKRHLKKVAKLAKQSEQAHIIAAAERIVQPAIQTTNHIAAAQTQEEKPFERVSTLKDCIADQKQRQQAKIRGAVRQAMIHGHSAEELVSNELSGEAKKYAENYQAYVQSIRENTSPPTLSEDDDDEAKVEALEQAQAHHEQALVDAEKKLGLAESADILEREALRAEALECSVTAASAPRGDAVPDADNMLHHQNLMSDVQTHQEEISRLEAHNSNSSLPPEEKAEFVRTYRQQRAQAEQASQDINPDKAQPLFQSEAELAHRNYLAQFRESYHPDEDGMESKSGREPRPELDDDARLVLAAQTQNNLEDLASTANDHLLPVAQTDTGTDKTQFLASEFGNSVVHAARAQAALLNIDEPEEKHVSAVDVLVQNTQLPEGNYEQDFMAGREEGFLDQEKGTKNAIKILKNLDKAIDNYNETTEKMAKALVELQDLEDRGYTTEGNDLADRMLTLKDSLTELNAEHENNKKAVERATNDAITLAQNRPEFSYLLEETDGHLKRMAQIANATQNNGALNTLEPLVEASANLDLDKLVTPTIYDSNELDSKFQHSGLLAWLIAKYVVAPLLAKHGMGTMAKKVKMADGSLAKMTQRDFNDAIVRFKKKHPSVKFMSNEGGRLFHKVAQEVCKESRERAIAESKADQLGGRADQGADQDASSEHKQGSGLVASDGGQADALEAKARNEDSLEAQVRDTSAPQQQRGSGGASDAPGSGNASSHSRRDTSPAARNATAHVGAETRPEVAVSR